jgi:hypothetical protein
MSTGLTIAIITMLGVIAVYFWVVRRSKQEVAQDSQK